MAKLTKDFEPYKNLWMTTADWLRWHESWMNDSLSNIDPEQLALVTQHYTRLHAYLHTYVHAYVHTYVVCTHMHISILHYKVANC